MITKYNRHLKTGGYNSWKIVTVTTKVRMFIRIDQYIIIIPYFRKSNKSNSVIFFLRANKMYKGESKVLQYFANMRHNSATIVVFAEVVKVTNHTGLWDAELAWYSMSDIHWICLYGLKYNLKIHGFRLTWHCLIVKISWTIWILHSDQLYLHILHNKHFYLLPWCHAQVWTCKAKVLKLDYIAGSSVKLSDHIQHEAIDVSVHQLHDTTNYNLNCFGHVIHMLQMYQNIA